MASAKYGIIGGSGLYTFDGLEQRDEVEIETPYGPPSSAVVLGDLSGKPVAFIARHGPAHRIVPTEIPVRANIWALKLLGVERIVSVSAVGSLREDIHPLDFVVPDQLIDRTRGRSGTFFGSGVVAHIPFAEPFCPDLSGRAADALQLAGARVVRGGVCVVIEGPAFSTRAESFLYRSWNADIVGMTALPEAKLAREAEICYATMAAVTDYDCWRDDPDGEVSVRTVVENLGKSIEIARRGIEGLLSAADAARECDCGSALEGAIITAPEAIPERRRRELEVVAGRVLRAPVATTST